MGVVPLVKQPQVRLWVPLTNDINTEDTPVLEMKSINWMGSLPPPEEESEGK